MKKWIALIVAAVLIVGGTYFGSPYWAVRSLKQAAISGDADKLDDAVNFPAVRESMKSQLSAALIQKMNSDPEMRGNPFAGLGMMMIPAIVDRMVDTFVTADGIAALVRGSKPNQAGAKSENPDIEYEYHWDNLDRFRVTLVNSRTHESGPSLLFDRTGFADWKLVKLRLPDSFFDEQPQPGS